MDFRRVAVLAGALLVLLPAVARAQLPVTGGPAPGAYREHDAGGFLNVLPPGENGLANAFDLAAFEANQTRPANSDDQLPLYRDLLTGYPQLTTAKLTDYYKDASFGVKPE